MKMIIASTNREANLALKIMMAGASVVGLWVLAAVGFALARTDFQITELARQYLVAIGFLKDYETLVDFYTHIKGVEYLICLAFLGTFPAFYKYLNHGKKVKVK